VAVGELGHAAAARQLGRLTVLDALEVREDRLLDQPVRSALETRRRVFQARAEASSTLTPSGAAMGSCAGAGPAMWCEGCAKSYGTQ
jgi:hypothetical protein